MIPLLWSVSVIDLYSYVNDCSNNNLGTILSKLAFASALNYLIYKYECYD